MTITYIKTGEQKYDVLINGIRIGYVTKGWTRMGGWGWLPSTSLCGHTRANRGLAVKDLRSHLRRAA
jgi:hypothetical protein